MTLSGHSQRGHAELRLRLTFHGRLANARSRTTVSGVTRRFANGRAVASTLHECRRGGNEKGSN